MKRSLLLWFALIAHLFLYAQAKTNQDFLIEIQKAKVTVHSTVYNATTEVELELYNPNEKVMDGEIQFSLKEGQIINDFKLDVNGSMRDGVIIEKQQARVAYENIIRRRVDPGLLELTAANQYRIRVYPIAAKGKRFVSFRVQQLLIQKKNQADYIFPISFSNTVKKLNIDITVASVEMPFASAGMLQGKLFSSAPKKHLAFQTVNPTETVLLFSIPLNNSNSVCQYNDGECKQLFFGRVVPNELSVLEKQVSAVTVFWDVSSSAEKRNIEKELLFLEAYLKKYNPHTLQVVTFAIDVVAEGRFESPQKQFASIKRFLRAQKADGGTRLNMLQCKKYPADEYLLFSDGQTTFGQGGLQTTDKTVFSIYSSVAANVSLLEEIASSSGGKTVDLILADVQKAVADLDKPQWKPLISKEHINKFELHVIKEGESFLIKGINKENADSLSLTFHYAGQMQQVTVTLLQQDCVTEKLPEAAMLMNWGWIKKQKNSRDSLFSQAINHNIVTATTSLIVLDALEDYHQYKITPPKELLDEFKKLYPVVPDKKDETKREKDITVYTKLSQSLGEYNKKISWWDPQAATLSLKPFEEKSSASVASGDQLGTKESQFSGDGNKSSNLSEVVVVGYSAQRRRSVTGASVVVSGSELRSGTTVQSALQGRVAGLQITGDYNSVQLRGNTSIRGGGEPLYVIDGIRVDAATAMNMPTSDIESISVLKDAASSALYGSGAANGVIVIVTKKGQFTSSSVDFNEDLQDELVDSLDALDKTMRYDRYLEMKEHHKNIPSFYFEMAGYFFKQKQNKEALRILSNLAEIQSENHQLLRTLGYMLEQWNDYANAIEIYKMVLEIKEEEPQSYRDLALAYAFSGNSKEALNLLYKALSKDWGLYENRYNGLREIILTEINVLAQKDAVQKIGIDTSILKPLPVDLRIVVDWNKDETDIDLHVIEPGGEKASYSNKLTKAGGRMSNDFTQGYGPEVYEIKSAKKGVYKVKVDYYGDRYQKESVPSFIKLTVFKNYGKANQTVSIKTIQLDDDEGMIDLAEIKL